MEDKDIKVTPEADNEVEENVEVNTDTEAIDNSDPDKVTTEATAEDAGAENTDTETSDMAEEEPEDDAEKGHKKKFGKKGDKRMEALELKNAELEDRVMRQMAEFENYRKRTEKEKSQMFEMGAKNVIEKLLPVVDNFERGLAAVSDADKEDQFYKGMDLIYKQLMGELDKMDVKPIEALGTEFNPDYHNAVMQVESEEFEEGVVAQELQKGYTYKDTVIRHSMVAVAK